MPLDPDICYRALTARDPRFDGLFFVGVSTTGVYCRPVCPARTPGRDRCAFFSHPAEAERQGYRACFRCRPELAPGGAPQDSVPRLVRAAVARIDAGALNEAPVEALAAELGVTSRHLRRAMEAELGVTPIELAQSCRIALAKRLLQDTSLPLAEIAFAAGFSSVRRFNALFLSRFGRPPSAFRQGRSPAALPGAVSLRLDYRPPLEWQTLLDFLAARAVPGVERVEQGAYRRTACLQGKTGWISVSPDPDRPSLRAEISPSLLGALVPVVARLRGLFDLDAQPLTIAEHLARDPLLSPAVRRRPGLRLPGAFDGFEASVRAILGQQVSVRAATTLSGRLVERFGDPLESPFPGLSRLFPPPDRLAAAAESDIAAVGVPAARARAVLALARAVATGALPLERGADPEALITAAKQLEGIGDWTAHYLAMRALGWPDAFPASDLGVKKALGGASPRECERRAAAWRPFRAYAVIHLWTSPPNGAAQ